jgi:hypothetical protein
MKSEYEGGEKKTEEDFNISQGMYKILKQAIFPIVGNMFHPTYLMINTSILGKIKPDPACQS